jgi:polygalacturonase
MITRGCFTRWRPALLVIVGLLASAPAGGAVPPLPIINANNLITITNAPYNATNNGTTDNAMAISNAIVAAAAGGYTNGGYGGIVRIPAPGVFLSGPFPLKNNVNLQIDAGAILRMLPSNQYPGGMTNPPDYITGTSLTNLEISGSGAIDGQGAPWWPGYKTNSRPMVVSFSKCSVVLLQNFTISNAPEQNISIKGNNAGNVTIQGISVLAPASDDPTNPSHNTDAIDFAETNGLIQNCYLDTGDDNIAFGSGAGLARDILVTNCTCGAGHGISIGSYTSSGVSNITVINCTFNGTDNGLRIKSDNDHGGLVQNISYYNIGMTNVNFPIQVYAYYNWYGTPSGISPAIAASTNAATVTSTTPIYRNITFSNINATSVSGYPVGIIWARTEMPATNIVFNKVNVTGDQNFCLYNASGAQFIDSKINVSATSNTFALFNAQLIVTNRAFATNLITLDGLTTNGYGNSLAFYNACASLKNTNVFDDGPLTLGDSILTVSNNFMLFPSSVLNYVLDTNTNKVAVVGNLTLGGTINLTSGPGFGAGTNTLLTYTGTLSGNRPTLGSTPGGAYTYSLDTNTTGQVNLIVALPAPPAPTNLTAIGTNLLVNLTWNAVSGATGYNLKRGTTSGGPYPTAFSGLTVTNYSDAAVTNGVTYYYVVSAVNSSGESTNSIPASAAPLPSATPTNIVLQAGSGELQLSWPQDHLGWRLQIQTNSLNTGLGTNWVTVPNSTNVCQTNLTVNPTNGSVFLRLIYP